MSLIINYEEFQNICRTCLFIGKLRPIIDSVIIEIIRGITGIEVKSDTELPQKICESCFKKIYKINEFAVQWKRNESLLNKCKTDYLESKESENTVIDSLNIKEEILTIDEMVQIKEEIKDEHISKPIEYINIPRQTATDCNTSQTGSTTTETNCHTCSECNETFVRITELKKHQRLHKKVVFECEVCSMEFNESCALIEHHRTHKEQFPYTCDVCNKPIRHIATLNRHKEIHKNQKSRCDVCFKIFYDCNALQIHRCIHPFVCKICRKKFKSLHFLRRHKKAEHPVEYVDGLDLASRSELIKNPDRNDAVFEEVVIKSEPEEIISDLSSFIAEEIKSEPEEIISAVSSFIAEESDKNEADPLDALKYKKKNEHKHGTQNEKLLFNSDKIKCEISESDEMEQLSQVDPQNLLVINEEPSCSSFTTDQMNSEFYNSDSDSLYFPNDADGNKSPTNLETTYNNGKYDNCFDGKRTRDRNYCMFCKTTVLNFVRHITRNHLREPDVKKVLRAPVGSKERKNLLSLLRKRGNYMINLKKCTKPVKKTNVANKFLPCVYCLGFYSANQLWKHRKICIANLSKGAKMNRPCAEAQNLLVQHLKVDNTLRELVFPRMRADNVSMVAKNDALIRAFGARYIKIHEPEKHIVHVTSRKMRELAKLLMVLKDLDPGIANLFECLNAKYFENIVAAVKTVAKYDETKKIFASPTYALQIGTTLKHCCEIALTEDDVFDFILADVAKEEISNFVTLLESNWKLVIPNPPVERLEKTDDLNLEFSDSKTPASLKHAEAKNKRILVPWTTEQKKVVNAFFRNHITHRKAPKKPECEALKRANAVLLQNKNWLKIKVYVQNKYTK